MGDTDADDGENLEATRDAATRAMDEDEVDANVEDSFPASDPPSWTVGADHASAPKAAWSSDAGDGSASGGAEPADAETAASGADSRPEPAPGGARV